MTYGAQIYQYPTAAQRAVSQPAPVRAQRPVAQDYGTFEINPHFNITANHQQPAQQQPVRSKLSPRQSQQINRFISRIQLGTTIAGIGLTALGALTGSYIRRTFWGSALGAAAGYALSMLTMPALANYLVTQKVASLK